MHSGARTAMLNEHILQKTYSITFCGEHILQGTHSHRNVKNSIEGAQEREADDRHVTAKEKKKAKTAGPGV